MSGAKHTAGPWERRDAPYGYDIIVSDIATDCALWVASITTGPLGVASPFYPSRETCDANAGLISAAPDLFEAAALAIAALSFEQERALVERDAISFEQITQAKYALILACAKATGRKVAQTEAMPASRLLLEGRAP